MLLLVIITLVLTIPLASYLLSTILITDLLFIESLFSCLKPEILGGLNQQTFLLLKIPIILGGFSFIEESNILFTCFVPIMIYSNADTNRSQILLDNKGRAGIYMWTNNISGKFYIGSAVNLSKRMRNYYSIGYLERNKSMYICNALFHHGYSAFSLTIFEYINTLGLSASESKELILRQEQLYFDTLLPEYNILKTAGSRLGSLHTKETRALISESMIGINQGRTHSSETKALMSKALSGNNHPRGFLGKIHSPDTIAKISITHKGKTLSAETKALISEALLGKKHSSETKAKISIAKGTAIYVYDTQGTLINTFSSARKAAEALGSNYHTILKYAKNGNIFKDKWKLSTSEL